MRDWKELVAVGLALLGLAFVVTRCTACKEAREAAAESAYTAEHLRCVDKAQSLEESRACRRDVDLRWGVFQLTDAGGDR